LKSLCSALTIPRRGEGGEEMHGVLPDIDEIIELFVEAIAPNGKGKGRCDAAGRQNLSFFIAGTAPGDRITARVTGARKRYVEADLVEIVEASSHRVSPVCPHYELCGGCQLMHLAYPAQLEAKREIVRYVLGRRGFARDLVRPMVASPRELRYRRRAKLSLTEETAPGLVAWHSHRIVPINSCHQMRQELQDGLLSAAPLAGEMLPASARARYLFGVYDAQGERVLVQAAAADSTEATNWFVAREREVKAEPHPPGRLRVAGFDLQYSPECFTQINAETNELLVAHVIDAMSADAGDNVLELFAGVGNFTLPLAAKAKTVTAVEWPQATHFAEINAEAAGLNNITHLGRNVSDALRQLMRAKTRFDLALLDPPREGLGEVGSTMLCELSPRRIVYVSCEPVTLANDLKVLQKHGYQLAAVTPFDMFPQTFHVETCAVLDKK